MKTFKYIISILYTLVFICSAYILGEFLLTLSIEFADELNYTDTQIVYISASLKIMYCIFMLLIWFISTTLVFYRKEINDIE